MSDAKTSQLKPRANTIIDPGQADKDHKILLPKNSTASLAEIPNEEGSIAYDTDQQTIVINDGSGFAPVSGGGSGDATSIQGINVSATAPNDGEALVYDSGAGEWTPTPISATAGGANGNVQFNSSGSFDGDDQLNWNDTSKSLVVGTRPSTSLDAPFEVWGPQNGRVMAYGSSSGGGDGAVEIKTFPTYGEIQGSRSEGGATQTLKINNEGGDLFLGHNSFDMVIDSNQIGIGLSNPQAKVHIIGDMWLDPTNTSGATGGLVMVNAADLGGNAFDFAVNVFGNNNLLLNPAGGNIGIGMVGPGDLLQIHDFDDTSNAYLKLATAGGTLYKSGIKLKVFNDNNGFTIENDDTTDNGTQGLNIKRHENDGTGVSALWISRPTGYVGINNASPQYELHVNGTSRLAGAIVGGGGNQGAAGSSIVVGEGSGTTLAANQRGSIAVGLNQGGTIRTADVGGGESGGGAVFGKTGSGGTLEVTCGDNGGGGGMAHGKAGGGATLKATGSGGLAGGRAEDSGSLIESQGNGSIAHGSASSGSQLISVHAGIAMGQAINNFDIIANSSAVAIGNSSEQNHSAADAAQSFGDSNISSGTLSTSFGQGHTNASYGAMLIGRYGELNETTGSWVATETAFAIGNGTALGAENIAFSISKSGVLNMPDYTKVRYTTDSGQLIPQTTPTVVIFEDSDYDNSGGDYNPATGVFTAPHDGYYDVKSTVTIDHAGESGVILLCAFVDGTEVARGQRLNVSTGGTTGMHYSDVLFLSAGEQFTIQVRNETSGDTNLEAYGPSNILVITQLP